MGLRDMKLQVLRTPLDPLLTFKDDANRLIRTVRFSHRFNFKIDESIRKASENTQIRETIRTKISEERYATELDKMFEGPNPVAALKDLNSMKLL